MPFSLSRVVKLKIEGVRTDEEDEEPEFWEVIREEILKVLQPADKGEPFPEPHFEVISDKKVDIPASIVSSVHASLVLPVFTFAWSNRSL